nr:uroporphyrinogen-III synthase [Komagataeibacter sp. FNDCR2]
MAAVQAMGLQPFAAPMLRIEHFALSTGAFRPDALVLTSAQAIAAIDRPQWHHLPCYVVGHATGVRARAVGFRHVVAATGTADDLLGLIRASVPARSRVLLAVGRGYGCEMADSLRAGGLRVLRRCVYAARPITRLPQPARTALHAGRVAAVMLYSARTAEAFLAALDAPLASRLDSVRAIVMSRAVAAALAEGPCWAAIHVASRPDQAAMLACVEQACCFGPDHSQ